MPMTGFSRGGRDRRRAYSQTRRRRAISRGAEIRYDYTAQAPWFNYTDAAGRTHVVWFEDARSVVARLQLVGEYSLAGISIWTADKVYRPGLYALQSMYSVEKLL